MNCGKVAAPSIQIFLALHNADLLLRSQIINKGNSIMPTQLRRYAQLQNGGIRSEEHEAMIKAAVQAFTERVKNPEKIIRLMPAEELKRICISIAKDKQRQTPSTNGTPRRTPG